MAEKLYCYKIKRNWFKLERLKKFGFDMFIPEGEEGEPDAEIFWAKTIKVKPDSVIGKSLKTQLELIWDKGGDTYRALMKENGYEFDKYGKLVENEAFLSGLVGQLCVSVNKRDADRGCLFINISGMEWHEMSVVRDCAMSTIMRLVANDAVYKKRIREKD